MNRPEKAGPLALKPGEMFTVGRRIYGRCAWCDSVVRINKPFFGSAHICSAATRDNTVGES